MLIFFNHDLPFFFFEIYNTILFFIQENHVDSDKFRIFPYFALAYRLAHFFSAKNYFNSFLK